MTNQEAVGYLDKYVMNVAPYGKWKEVVELAISALQALEAKTQLSAEGTTSDLISRQEAIDALDVLCDRECEYSKKQRSVMCGACHLGNAFDVVEQLPSVEPELCEYYALCRHGRDENKLRADLGFCDYCNEDSDGYVKPIEKNNHAFVRFGMDGWELDLRAKGWHGSAKIMYCPMCGMELKHE